MSHGLAWLGILVFLLGFQSSCATRAEPFIRAPKERNQSWGHWPQWRGPNRDNVSTDTGLLKNWPEGGPPLAWKVEGIGGGIAAVAVAGGRVFTLGFIGESEYVTALDEATGRRLWAARIGSTRGNIRHHFMRVIAQRTPTVDGDRLYALQANGNLVCLSVEDGRELWRVDYVERFRGERPMYGFCDYPLVDGRKLIIFPNGADAAVAALDKHTGELIWQTLPPEPVTQTSSAYGAAVISEGGGTRQVIAIFSDALRSVRASDGALLWKYGGKGDWPGLERRTPIVRGRLVWGSPALGEKLVHLELRADGDGVAYRKVYSSRMHQMRYYDAKVLLGDHLYDVASRGVMALNAHTGENPIWLYSGRPGVMTVADGHFYVHGYDGSLTLVEARLEEVAPKSSFVIPDWERARGATHPVVTGGKLYIRNENRLYCFTVRKGAPSRAKNPVVVLPEPPDARPFPRSGVAGRSIFVSTPPDVVEKMLEAAEVKKGDVVYDLGSGDGVVLLTAARRYGCRTVGYEIDAKLVALSRAKAREAGLDALVRIQHGDMFRADLESASVVCLYHPPEILERLKPRLETLEAGARIVSHQFKIPGLKPVRSLTVESNVDGESHDIHVWTAPLDAKDE